MYAQMPDELKTRIDSLLNTNNFGAAKAIYDKWHLSSSSSAQKHINTDQIQRMMQRDHAHK